MENIIMFIPHIIGVSFAIGFVIFAKHSKTKELKQK